MDASSSSFLFYFNFSFVIVLLLKLERLHGIIDLRYNAYYFYTPKYLRGNTLLLQWVKVGCLLFQRLLDGNFSSKIQLRKVLKKVLRKYFTLPENMEEEWKTDIINYYTSVTFVRHPFVRLVSAFKDKIIDHDYHRWRFVVDYEKEQIQKVSFSKFMNFINVWIVLYPPLENSITRTAIMLVVELIWLCFSHTRSAVKL